MSAFDDLKPGSRLRGLEPSGIAKIVQVARFGADALNVFFRVDGRVGERLVYRGEEIEAQAASGFDDNDISVIRDNAKQLKSRGVDWG